MLLGPEIYQSMAVSKPLDPKIIELKEGTKAYSPCTDQKPPFKGFGLRDGNRNIPSLDPAWYCLSACHAW